MVVDSERRAENHGPWRKTGGIQAVVAVPKKKT